MDSSTFFDSSNELFKSRLETSQSLQIRKASNKLVQYKPAKGGEEATWQIITFQTIEQRTECSWSLPRDIPSYILPNIQVH